MDWIAMTDAEELYGSTLDPSDIVCPYCLSKGNFNLEYAKERQNSTRDFNSAIWTVFLCGVCANRVFIIYSKSKKLKRVTGRKGNGELIYTPYDKYYRSVWPERKDTVKTSDDWPERPKELYIQAQRALTSSSWDSALGMARASMQSIMKEMNAPKGTIESQIDKLILQNKLPPVMGEWAHEIRKNGNSVLHGDLDFVADQNIAKEIVNFNLYLLEYLYTLPAKIEKIRKGIPKADDLDPAKAKTDNSSTSGTVVSPQAGGRTET